MLNISLYYFPYSSHDIRSNLRTIVIILVEIMYVDAWRTLWSKNVCRLSKVGRIGTKTFPFTHIFLYFLGGVGKHIRPTQLQCQLYTSNKSAKDIKQNVYALRYVTSTYATLFVLWSVANIFWSTICFCLFIHYWTGKV